MKRELTSSEYHMFDLHLYECGWDRDGCKIYFNDKTGFGSYHHTGDYIQLIMQPMMIKELTPCLIHELTHRRQRKELGYWHYALLNLFSRELEIEAVKNERNAETVLGIEI